jgi:hypothetical protein
MSRDMLTSIMEAAAGLGTGGLLVLVGWHLLRLLLCALFVLIMCRVQRRATGRYPTLDDATWAMRELLDVTRPVPPRGTLTAPTARTRIER